MLMSLMELEVRTDRFQEPLFHEFAHIRVQVVSLVQQELRNYCCRPVPVTADTRANVCGTRAYGK